jgi:hypothetical protein
MPVHSCNLVETGGSNNERAAIRPDPGGGGA